MLRRFVTKTIHEPMVGVLLKRNPVILRELTPFEQAYMIYRSDREQMESRPFDHTFYFKKGSLAEKKWLEAQQTIEDEASGLKQPAEEELEKLQVASRSTEADATSNTDTLDRSLDRTLYFVVEKNGRWIFPQAPVASDELLHLAAEKHVGSLLGTDVKTWLVGNKPVGFSSDAEHKKSVFYMKFHLLSGSSDSIDKSLKGMKYAWLTKQELESRMSPSYFQQVSNMLSQL